MAIINSLAATDNIFFSSLIEHFYQYGWVFLPQFLTPELNAALLHEAQYEADLTLAGIGRSNAHQLNMQIRRDATKWFDGQSSAQQNYLQLMAKLQQALNRQCFLGLFDFECHFARYQQGDFYKKHLDAFKGRTNRVLTTVSYLNTVKQGGQLALYDEKDTLIKTITPTAGSLLLFESERFPHEVLPAQDPRFSIAGWFRKNANINGVLDPAN